MTTIEPRTHGKPCHCGRNTLDHTLDELDACAIESFYVASSGDGLGEVVTLSAILESRGLRNAFPWPQHWYHKCAPEVCGLRDRRDLGAREIDAARTCDLFVGIARLGKGSHVEFGMALTGRARRIVLVGVNAADSVFYGDARVEHAATVAEAADILAVHAAPVKP